MDKFWKWMEEREYGYIEDLGHRKRDILCIPGKIYITGIEPTKQMLIGYMIEYLVRQQGVGVAIAIRGETIESYHDRLVDEIERRV